MTPTTPIDNYTPILIILCGLAFLFGCGVGFWWRGAEVKAAEVDVVFWKKIGRRKLAELRRARKSADKTIDGLHVALSAQNKELAEWRAHGVRRDSKSGRILPKENYEL